MASATLATTATAAQAVAYLSSQWGTYKYANSSGTPYNGLDASQLYAYLAKENPSASPYDIAVAVSDLLLSSGFASAVGAGADESEQLTQDTASGLESASYLPSFEAGILGALTSKNTWIRVAKVVIGGALLIIGLAHITGADNVIANTARKVPVIV